MGTSVRARIVVRREVRYARRLVDVLLHELRVLHVLHLVMLLLLDRHARRRGRVARREEAGPDRVVAPMRAGRVRWPCAPPTGRWRVRSLRRVRPGLIFPLWEELRDGRQRDAIAITIGREWRLRRSWRGGVRAVCDLGAGVVEAGLGRRRRRPGSSSRRTTLGGRGGVAGVLLLLLGGVAVVGSAGRGSGGVAGVLDVLEMVFDVEGDKGDGGRLVRRVAGLVELVRRELLLPLVRLSAVGFFVLGEFVGRRQAGETTLGALALGPLGALGPPLPGRCDDGGVLDDHPLLDLGLGGRGRERVVKGDEGSHRGLVLLRLFGVNGARMLTDVVEAREGPAAVAFEWPLASMFSAQAQRSNNARKSQQRARERRRGSGFPEGRGRSTETLGASGGGGAGG